MNRFSAAVVLVLFALAMQPARADLILDVDQANIGPISGGFGIAALSPIGQEFVPDFLALNRVELSLSNAVADRPVTVNIREGTIGGPVLGSSMVLVPLTVPPISGQVIGFDFPFDVPLTPGNLYVIEVTTPAETGLTLNFPSTSYPRGRAIVSGQPDASFDFYFAEGLVVPEPSTLTLAGLGAMVLLGFTWGSKGVRTLFRETPNRLLERLATAVPAPPSGSR